MRRRFTVVLILVVALAAGSSLCVAGENPSANTSAKNEAAKNAASSAAAPEPSGAAAIGDPLLRLLVTKGILTATEAGALRGTPAANQQQLLELLKNKGILSDSDLSSLTPSIAAASSRSVETPMMATLSQPAEAQPAAQAATAQKPAAPAAPPVIPAVAPIRVLPIDTPRRDGLVPAIKLGPVKMTPYGYIKMSVVHDTSQPRGDDFPLPGFLFGDTGPNAAPEFHVKARNSRFGANFEWLDKSERLTLVGRLEADFEGNYTSVDNRNVSSARSSMPSLRLASARLDYAATKTTTVSFLVGQDWTPFGSSTLPNTLEGTGVGISFGSLYERAPMVKGGFVHNFGGSRTTKLQMEVAAVSPFFGNVPSGTQFQIPGTVPGAGSNSNVFTVAGCTPLAPATTCTVTVPQTANTGLGLANQLAFGERQGADSSRPEIEGRVALQFQLDKAPGVAPAQIILSGVQGERKAIVPVGNIPNAPAALGTAFYRNAFPHGVEVTSDRWGFNPSIQLPTRYFTLIGSYYRGADLRWFFAGELFSFYNNTVAQGLINAVTAPSIDGSAAVVFGTSGGAATVAQQKPIRTQGGFLELGLPLSRWAHANPTGRGAGWTMNLHYGLDDTFAKDVRRAAPGGARDKSDWAFANLQYKLNQWVTFGLEEGMYRTRALPNAAGSFAATTFKGLPAREWKDIRSEFSTVFTF